MAGTDRWVTLRHVILTGPPVSLDMSCNLTTVVMLILWLLIAVMRLMLRRLMLLMVMRLNGLRILEAA